MQRELLDDKLISFMIEWCETPDRRKPGIAYEDVAVLYDNVSGPVKLVKLAQEHDIYMRIPHPLLDPLLPDATIGLSQFYNQTFWAIQPVLNCFFAAQALARRGINVDRCFMGVSPGGTGQSLYSTLLAAQYGSLHYFYDPNIWFHDEELRKQVPNFVGCCILTGQESPEGGRRLREDLFKKTVTGDGISYTLSFIRFSQYQL